MNKGWFSKFLRYEENIPETYEGEEDYKEIKETSKTVDRSKLSVKIFDIKEENHINEILDKLREGKTIALINTSYLKDDSFLMKLAIRRIKKTCEAIDGDIAGLSENLFVATPSFVRVAKRDTTTSQPEL